MQVEFEETTEALAQELAIAWASDEGFPFKWRDELGRATAHIERIRKLKQEP